MNPGDILYGRETSFGSGETDQVRLLRKVRDPDSGAGSALRAEFEEEDIEELVPAGRGPIIPSVRIGVTYGGNVRAFLFPFGNVDAFLENVLWDTFRSDRSLSDIINYRTRNSLVVKTISDTNVTQVFRGAMLQELSIDLIRGQDGSQGESDYRSEVSLSLTSTGYELEDEENRIPIGPNENEAIGTAGNTVQSNLNGFAAFFSNYRDGGQLVLAGPEGTVDVKPNDMSVYFRPDLRAITGLGAHGPQDFCVGSAPFECGGTVRFPNESEEFLKKFIDQDYYRFELHFTPSSNYARQYKFEFPRIVFTQGWVVPPDDEAGHAYNAVEWVALHDDALGYAAKIRKQ